MMNIEQVTNNLKSYIDLQLDSMAASTPVVNFLKPIITRAIDKNFTKVTTALDLISDQNGNIDIEGISTDMLQSLRTVEPFTLNTSFIGDIEIGGGAIKLNVPFTNKRLVLDSTDLETFKNMLINKV